MYEPQVSVRSYQTATRLASVRQHPMAHDRLLKDVGFSRHGDERFARKAATAVTLDGISARCIRVQKMRVFH